MPVGLALFVVQHVAEVAGVRVPGMLLQGVAPERNVLLITGDVLVLAQHAGHLGQHARGADEVGVDDGGRGARRELLLVHEDLRRVIVPAGVVEVTPGLEQAGLEGAGIGAAEPAGEEEVILPEPRIEVFEQGARLGQVPEFEEEVMLHRQGGAVLDESGFGVAGFGGVGVEAVNGAARRRVAPGRCR